MSVGSSKDTTNDIFHVLGLFSDINCLNITSVTQVVEGENMTSFHIPRNFRCSSVKLEDVPTSIYLRALGRTESAKTLRTIDADCVDLEDMEALSELLQQTGANLEELVVNLAQCFNDFVYTEDSDETFVPSESICACE